MSKNVVEFGIKLTDLSKGSTTREMMASLSNIDELVDEIVRSVKATSTEFDNATKAALKFNQVADAIESVNDVLQSVVAPARSFETAMRAVNTMAGLDDKGFSELTDKVAGLSREIPVARDLLANGLYQVISNGVPKDNWLTFLESSAKSSVGGIADLEKVVTVTSTVIKNYGLSWEQAGGIQDKIQATAKNGVTTFEQLSEALPKVSGSASTLGISIDELLGSFATLTGVSGNTAEVGTQLSAVLTSLIRPTSEATKLASAMGVEFNAASVKAAGGLNEFLTQLDATVDGYAQRNGLLKEEILGTLFSSSEALRAVIPLTGELADAFATNTEAVAGSTGTMAFAFEQMNSTTDSADRRFKNLMSSLSDFIGSITSAALPTITFIAYAGQAAVQVKGLYEVVRSFNAKSAIMTTLTKAQALASKAVSGATALYRTAISALTVAFGSAKVAAVAFWSAATLGVGVIIWGIVEAISAFTGESEENTAAIESNTEAQRKAQDAQNNYNNALGGARSEMALAIAEINNFTGSKEAEAQKISELNNKYGDVFGTYNTLSQWYDTLTQKSSIYAKYIANEVKIRQLAETAASKSIKLDAHNEYGRKNLNEQIAANPTVPVADITAWVDEWNSGIDMVVEDAKAANKRLEEAIKEQGLLAKQLSTGTPKPTGTGGGSGDSADLVEDPSTIDEINVALSHYEKKLRSLNAMQVEQARATRAKIEVLKEEKATLESLGIDRTEQSIVGLKPLPSAVKLPSELPSYSGTIEYTLEMRLNGLQRVQDEIARLTELFSVATTPDEQNVIQSQIDQWDSYGKKLGEVNKDTIDAQAIIGGLGSALGSVSGAIEGSGGAWLSYAANALSAISSMIPALLAVALGEGAAGAMKTPFPYNLIALAASSAAVVSAFASIPKFADGGIAYGPTLGLFGEYSGAANNPEVVAPLNKLRSLIQPADSGVGEVRFEIHSRTLVGILKKANRISSRT